MLLVRSSLGRMMVNRGRVTMGMVGMDVEEKRGYYRAGAGGRPRLGSQYAERYGGGERRVEPEYRERQEQQPMGAPSMPYMNPYMMPVYQYGVPQPHLHQPQQQQQQQQQQLHHFDDHYDGHYGEEASPAASKAGKELQTMRVVTDGAPLEVTEAKGTMWRRFLLRLVGSLATTGLFLFVMYRMFKPAAGKSGGILGELEDFTKPLHKEAMKVSVTFDEVKGVDEAKNELQHVVEYLRDNRKFYEMGAKLPKGVLLIGSPGTGKTLLARALAGEAGVPFLHCSGSDFDEIFVGSGSRRIRKLFQEAKAKAPCIVFVDEIDTLGRRRGVINSGREATLNKLLAELDGFEDNSGVVIIGATNFPDSLDRALIRPGRFDKIVHVDLPDLAGRRDILKLYLDRVKTSNDVDLELLARTTIGFSGAQIANLVNEAAIKAVVEKKKAVEMIHLHAAFDDSILGMEKKSRKASIDDVKLTAYHECGHTLVAYYTKDAMPIRKITIVPRGSALGYLSQVPEADASHQKKNELVARIAVAMGGRAAEELIYGADSVTTGASSDLKQATRVATAMVKQLGMSDKVGHLYIDKEDGHKSSALDNVVHQEIVNLLDAQYQYAKDLLSEHEDELHRLVSVLLERETLHGDEVDAILKGK